MHASNSRKARLPVFLGILIIGCVARAQAAPLYTVVDLGLQSASPVVPDTLLNPRLTNAAGDRVVSAWWRWTPLGTTQACGRQW